MLTITTTFALALAFNGGFATQAAAQNIGGFLEIGGRDFGIGIGFGKRKHRKHRKHRSRRHCHGRACGAVRHAGRYNLVRNRVWRRGHYNRVRVPARYETRYRCGRPYRYCVQRAGYRRVHVAGHWDYENRRVWADPYTSYACGY